MDVRGDPATDGTVTITNLDNDNTVSNITTSDGFSRLEVENVETDGQNFRISEVGFGDFESGDPIDMDFDLLVTDADGDTSTGMIDVTVLPALEGTAGNDTLISSGDAEFLVGGLGNDTLTGDAGADIFVFSLAADDGDDTITDFVKAEDILMFTDVIDQDANTDVDLDDIDLLTTITDDGTDVTMDFTNGASITFLGIGDTTIDTFAELVDNTATQIIVTT